MSILDSIKQTGIIDTLKGVLSPSEGLKGTKDGLKKIEGQLKPDNYKSVLKTQLFPVLDKDLGGKATQAQLEEAHRQIDQEVADHLLENSPEKKAVDDFIGHIENIGKVKEILDSNDPARKAKSWASNLPFGEEIGETLSSWAADLKKQGGLVAGMAAGFVGRLAKFFSNKVKEVKQAVEEWTEDLGKTIVEKYGELKVAVNDNLDTLKADFAWLAQADIGIKVDSSNIRKWIEDVFVKNEDVKNLIKTADESEPAGVSFKTRLKYLRLGKFEPDQIKRLTAIIEGKDGTYKLPTKNDESIHKLLGAVVDAKKFDNGLDSLGDTFKVKPGAASPAVASSPEAKPEKPAA